VSFSDEITATMGRKQASICAPASKLHACTQSIQFRSEQFERPNPLKSWIEFERCPSEWYAFRGQTHYFA
jgi:hypothetical protein